MAYMQVQSTRGTRHGIYVGTVNKRNKTWHICRYSQQEDKTWHICRHSQQEEQDMAYM